MAGVFTQHSSFFKEQINIIRWKIDPNTIGLQSKTAPYIHGIIHPTKP
jgi:hypothetical protein